MTTNCALTVAAHALFKATYTPDGLAYRDRVDIMATDLSRPFCAMRLASRVASRRRTGPPCARKSKAGAWCQPTKWCYIGRELT